jgi:hypothetical protein
MAMAPPQVDPVLRIAASRTGDLALARSLWPPLLVQVVGGFPLSAVEIFIPAAVSIVAVVTE